MKNLPHVLLIFVVVLGLASRSSWAQEYDPCHRNGMIRVTCTNETDRNVWVRFYDPVAQEFVGAIFMYSLTDAVAFVAHNPDFGVTVDDLVTSSYCAPSNLRKLQFKAKASLEKYPDVFVSKGNWVTVKYQTEDVRMRFYRTNNGTSYKLELIQN